MESKVYVLSWDISHSEDPEYDAFCWQKEIHLELKTKLAMDNEWFKKWKQELPNILYFHANFEMIPKYDFPYTDLSLPVMSKKMLNIIESINYFDKILIPVVMIDFTHLEYPFTNTGILNDSLNFNNDYCILYLTTHISLFDYSHSDYKVSKYNEGGVSFVRKLVIRESSVGFPPIFRLSEYPTLLLISSETKEALEANDIKGCVFEPVEVTPYSPSL